MFCSQVDTNMAPTAWTNWLRQQLNLILSQIQKVFGDNISKAGNILPVKTAKLNNDSYRERRCMLREGVNHIKDMHFNWEIFQLQDMKKLFLKEKRTGPKNLCALRKIDSSTPKNVLEKNNQRYMTTNNILVVRGYDRSSVLKTYSF